MPDIATIWNATTQRGDWQITANDLATEGGLATAVAISLGTDRRADDGDALPLNSADPRGWWGDIPADGGPADPWGVKFWLRRRASFSGDIANILIADAQQALQWLIDDGVAASVTVTAQTQSPPLGTVVLTVTINRATPTGAASPQFATTWAVTTQ